MALFDLTKAIELAPKDTRGYFGRGELLFNQQKFELAGNDFNQVILIDSLSTKAYYNRGLCYFYLRLFNEACKDVGIAYELGDTSALPFLNANCRPQQ